MSSDNDKTVFRPRAANNPDSTILRPTPGRRGGGQREARPAPPQPSSYEPAPRTDVEPSYFRHSNGLNPLVNAASTLIAVIEKTRNTATHPDIAGLHQRLINEINAFQKRVQEIGIKSEICLAGRYLLCSALDEMILNTPWGAESQWPQKTLLSVFHNETSGGEKFFQILDRMRQTPSENLDMLELIYILLSLGFEGRYRFANRGRDALEQLRDELFSIIRRHRGEYDRTLSLKWQGLGKSRSSLTQYLPMWVVASVVAAILVVSYSGFRYWLYDASAPVVSQLNEIVEADKKEKEPKP
ncbi:DotU family type IV/VI secretion system protein [Aliikangiella marina]|uniref:DotU family type IV/VI secretion system protein n=1 Tax=Aliikangiella marina TaxID=1712262 RepID=A0A545TGV0_9GAMM|nr:type IVB secretion system protein IcmH/DotU [Aliikangiella marina]TQV76418.1 DotU family type IV/VI secretion system protein [Aliikangiella marina]